MPSKRVRGDGSPHESPLSTRTAIILNPLGQPLRHYATELQQVLSESVTVRVCETGRPLSRWSRLRWFGAHVRSIASAARSTDLLVVCWPLLGAADLLLAASAAAGRRTRVLVVVHDPLPVRHQLGLGARTWSVVARLVRWSTRLEVIAHSQEALLALRELGVHPRQIVQVPHPILRPSDRGSNSRRSVARAIRVLGQFKDGRDRDLLQGMARHLEQLLPDVERSIHGSDWPAVDGWSVDARFVPEAEFEALIAEAGVIVIPYRHFFQSGVAVRALERAVPVVLPRTSFGEGTFGASASCLLDDADPEAWAAAVARALNSTPDLQRQHEVVREQASQRWAAAVSPKRDH